ncbi:hypothetical protein H7F50_09990 [Novosphingobium flavum]|uniref:Uncharacterized protein n=1 Tax=Novosphingobium aerophilum TaxID=2839843 RepID=A0A7X1F7D5_9SPHN|nr:hypothetical protein [Novosphingobium aerophilum]MBC2651721.1 hypothetical protein [Novosphingobium aerophilum]MBC2662091.1 hypothetical protein [Novosphingobium aerophilum]
MLWALVMAAGMSDDAFARVLRQAPPDLRAVVERRLGCNHWGGEEPYDAERAAQIRDAAARLKCRSLERDEARMRSRYARRPAWLKLLRAAADRDG